MSGWRGLHNSERHEPYFDSVRCKSANCRSALMYSLCSESSPCRCCLAAEVERLTAEVQVLTAECALRPGQTPPRVIAHVRILEAEAERLTAELAEREVCPATNTLLGNPTACDRGKGHTGPHMSRGSWQWFDAPEQDET